jgi:hypothetical protein
MAVREFHATLKNSWDSPLVRTADDVDGGQWQEPFLPSQVPGAGRIEPSLEGEWRSESDGVATGTSGWARWATRVVDPFENPPEHFEWFQVNWSVPFLGKPDLTWGTTRIDPASSDARFRLFFMRTTRLASDAARSPSKLKRLKAGTFPNRN